MGKEEEYRLTLKEMPVEERPREKILRYGAGSLSNAELLALILRVGTRKDTALGLAQNLLGKIGSLRGLLDYAMEELMAIEGIGLAKAAQLQAVAEICRRIPLVDQNMVTVRSPKDAAHAVMPRLRYLKQEVFCLILLNTKNKIISIEHVTTGGLNSSIVHPREVFNRAIRRSSAGIILAHNHPSGDPRPSREDIRVTRRLVEVGQLVGIQVLDHIIIGDGNYSSLKEEGVI